MEQALADTAKTCREVARELGYSAKWMAAMSVNLGIERKRGGDRRSPAAKARFSRGTVA
jgi:hypothetical protein